MSNDLKQVCANWQEIITNLRSRHKNWKPLSQMTKEDWIKINEKRRNAKKKKTKQKNNSS